MGEACFAAEGRERGVERRRAFTHDPRWQQRWWKPVSAVVRRIPRKERPARGNNLKRRGSHLHQL